MELSELDDESIRMLDFVFKHHYMYDKFENCSDSEKKKHYKDEVNKTHKEYQTMTSKTRDYYDNLVCDILENEGIINCEPLEYENRIYNEQVHNLGDKFYNNGMFKPFIEKKKNSESKSQNIGDINASGDVTIQQSLGSVNSPQTQKKKNKTEKGSNKPHKHQYVAWIVGGIITLVAIIIPLGASKGWWW